MWGKILFSLFIIILSSFGISNVVFAEVFYQNPIVLEHTNILNIMDATIPGTNQIQVSVEYISGSNDIISVILNRVGTSDNFRSEFVTFTSGVTDDFTDKLHVDIGTDVVLVRYGTSEWYSSVITNNPILDTLPSPISPSMLLGRSNTACNTLYGGDSDYDFICNKWETQNGLVINYPSGANYNLPCTLPAIDSSYSIDPLGTSVCPSTLIKDLYIEIDYMVGHKPDLDALKNVVSAFRSAPINKINLHIFLSETPLDHRTSILFPGSVTTPGFLNLKAKEFGTESEQQTNWLPNNVPVNYAAKSQVFQYFLWGHDAVVSGTPSGSPSPSGISDSANDGAVTLGSFSATVTGSRKQQEGTFMHELGHNLGLNHGGIKTDQNNCKPNLLSVMNYAYQFGDFAPNQLDYSRQAIGTNTAGSTSLGSESSLSGTVMDVADSNPTGQYIVYGNGNGQVLTKQLPETIAENHSWPTVWTNIRTLVDSQGNVFCSPTIPSGQQTPPIQLTGVNQWASLNFAHSGSNWSQGKGADVQVPSGTSTPGCDLTDECYLPSTITVEVGDTVTWTNTDTAAHTVTSGNPDEGPSGLFDSSLISSGTSFSYTFDNTGTFDYFCMVHPWMSGSVNVNPISHISEYIIPNGASCISLEDAQEQSNSYRLNLDDAPICFTEITNSNVLAGRSTHIDSIIAELTSVNEAFFKNSSSKDTLIDALENIRVLILSNKVYETIDSYTNFKKLIDTEITDISTKNDLLYLVDLSTYTLNPVGDVPSRLPGPTSADCIIPDEDEDGVLCALDLCPDTPKDEKVDEKGCTIVPPPPYWLIILIIVIIVIGIVVWQLNKNSKEKIGRSSS